MLGCKPVSFTHHFVIGEKGSSLEHRRSEGSHPSARAGTRRSAIETNRRPSSCMGKVRGPVKRETSDEAFGAGASFPRPPEF